MIIFLQNVSAIDPHCDNITSLKLLYKVTTPTNISIVRLRPDVNMFVIVPDEEGQYDIKLVIENTEGYQSSTEANGIHVMGMY